MRVVVTGATGNVGTAVVAALAADAAVGEVVGLARRAPGPARMPWPSPKVRLVQADVAADDLSPVLAGADALVHLAWLFQPTHRPSVTWQVNAVGSSRVFEAAARAGVRTLVHASSVGAYSPAPVGAVVDETWPTHSRPESGYGREKAYVERVLDAFAARHPDIRVVRMRPAFIFQRTAATEQRRIFLGPFVPNGLLVPGRLPILPMPSGLRIQAVHASDVAEAYRLAVVGDAAGAFNLAAPPVLDGRALAAILGARAVDVPAAVVRHALGVAWRLRLVPAEPALLDLVLSVPQMDASRAARELGWTPLRTGTEAVEEAVHAMAEGAGGATPPLAPDTAGGRAHELATGVGQRDA